MLCCRYATCGKNIPNVRVYVVAVTEGDDPHRPTLTRVPVGQVCHKCAYESCPCPCCSVIGPLTQAGEVFVGGPVLARGYLAMPAKTAQRFVANPFGAKVWDPQ